MIFPMFSPDRSGIFIQRGGRACYVPIDRATAEDIAAAVAWEAPPEVVAVVDPTVEAAELPPISMAQLLSGLVEREMITAAEGEAWLAGNAMPDDVLTVISTFPASLQFRARAQALRMTKAERLNPIVTGLGALRNMDAAALNEFWRYCMEI